MPNATILSQGSEFSVSAKHAATYLRRRGFSTRLVELDDEDIPLRGRQGWTLETLPTGQDLSVWYAHGGWDGPLIFDTDTGTQIDPSDYPKHWPTLTRALQRHIVAGGMFVVHSCHSSGSNRYESTEGSMAERWVQQVARATARFAVGVEGSTAAANHHHARALLGYALDGRRWIQASRAYDVRGQHVTRWRGWLSERGAAGSVRAGAMR